MAYDSIPHAPDNGANQAGSFLFPKPPFTLAEETTRKNLLLIRNFHDNTISQKRK